ncbi:MAG: hypothetical protein AAF296_01925 [Pseudomonadota bacterium]
MSKTISGHEALTQIDRSISRLRKRLSDAIENADMLERREVEVRDEQLLVYTELADIRMQFLDDASSKDLDRTHKRALSLLADHDTKVAEQRSVIKQAETALQEVEAKQDDANSSLSKAFEAHEDLVEKVEDKLSSDKAYQALVLRVDQAEAIESRATEKLSVARDEREEKGEPYRSDALFMYLWERGFRTTEYKGRGLFKMLDGWVAKLCRYDDARANYQRLNDIPKWLEQHLSDREADTVAAKADLEQAEQTALQDAGIDDARSAINAIKGQLDILEKRRNEAEDDFESQTRRYQSLSAGQEGPIKQARGVLIEGMKRFAFEDLRELAAETVTTRDDELVDRLVTLRTEELDLEVSAEHRRLKPVQLQHDLSAFEALRRGFKAAQLDSHYARFRQYIVHEAIEDISKGLSEYDAVLSRLRRSVKRKKPKTDYRFGGRRRLDTLGLPEILGDIGREVVREIEREISRGGGGFGGYSGGSRRGRRTSFPSPKPRSRSRKSSKRRGRRGFKTGGRF